MTLAIATPKKSIKQRSPIQDLNNCYNYSYVSSLVETMQVKDLTVEQLQTLIRSTVDERLDEYFGDPDQGKEIKESFMQSLLNIQKKRVEGRATIPASEVYKRYGIER
jgi:hypothetical protein